MFLEVGVMIEGQVPMPYPFTGVRTLIAQASPVPYSGRAWALQGLPSSVTLHMKDACSGDEQAVRAALGDHMSLNVLMRALEKALFSAGLLDRAPFDPWQQMAKGMSQCDLRSCSPRVLLLPDAYLHDGGSIVR